MGDISNARPLTRASVIEAHELIKTHIHRTPVMTCGTIDNVASTPQEESMLQGTEWEGQPAAKPRMRFFFKCENYQKVGAFKARGAYHALARLQPDELKRGVVTHSSALAGNHAQALSLAAKTYGVPAHIVMPTISTPSKIAGTKGYGANVVFSGPTSQEREAVVAKVIEETGATLVPPYDHPNIMIGQGTMALELEEQAAELLKGESSTQLNAVITPCGGGGMLSGVATALAGTGTLVFGSEPSFQGGDDARRGLLAGERITTVKTLTIADGLRTPLGAHPWSVISDPTKVRGIFAVTEDQIKDAMRLVLERMKVFIEPSAAVPLAVCLFNEDFRRLVEKEGGEQGWNIGVVLSGGNTTMEAVSKLFGPKTKAE